jgi:polyhydroxyalkanoate synthase subunit PhaE
MDPFEYAKSIANMWALGGKALLSAQEAGARAMGTAAAPGILPDMSMLPDLTEGMADLARAGQSVTELWSSATSLSQALARKLPMRGGADATVEATFQKMADPRSWFSVTGEMDELLGRMAEGPRFSDLWDVERKYARVYRAWLNLRQRGLEQTAVVLGAWQRAGRLFSEQVGGAGDTVRSADAALHLWTETANRVLLEMQRSEAFLEAQARSIRASTELRMAQHELVEFYGERYGFPTRRELDDVHKTVTELRRELRALRRASAGRASPAPVEPVPVERGAAKPARQVAKRKPTPRKARS